LFVEQTFDTICVVLEDHPAQATIEEVAQLVIDALDELGNDMVEHLDPPEGLRTWLKSHGLSLVATRQVTPPAVWSSIEEGDDQEAGALEEESRGSLLLQVGGMIEYRTASSGPRQQSQIGMGKIVELRPDDTLLVTTGPAQFIWLDATKDFIHPLPSPGEP
jgi:hypothetical protein